MIIEYLNESTDILASKVYNEEITLEEAFDAYNDLADKALDEWTDELIEAVECGAITEAEADLILEMSGIFENDVVLEADYDLSKLSPQERATVQAKLKALPDNQRKKVEKELAKKFPSQEYKDKVDRRKKVLAGVGAAAAVGTAAALGARHAIDKDAENRSINEANPAYAKFFKQRDRELAKLNNDPKYKDIINANSNDKALAAGAQVRLGVTEPAKVGGIIDEYNDKLAAIDRRFNNNIGKTLNEERQKEGYKKQIRQQRKDLIKLDKSTKAQKERNKEYAGMNAEWRGKNNPFALLMKAKSAGASIGNAPTKIGNTINKFFGKTDKVKDLKYNETGATKRGIAKKAAQEEQEFNANTDKNAAKRKKDIYKN